MKCIHIITHENQIRNIKYCVRYIFASLLCMAKRGKNVFYFTSKALFVLKIISFNFSDIQMLWRHQMPKHETRDTIY